jgi:hypothetical protein
VSAAVATVAAVVTLLTRPLVAPVLAAAALSLATIMTARSIGRARGDDVAVVPAVA